jgi:predicted HAD superfamily phosphohydrolase YqeG
VAEIKDRKRVMIDFDGTLRNSSTGEPTESAVKVIEELKKLGYEIFIFSTRVVYGGGNFIHEWLEEFGIEVDGVTGKKFNAEYYIDNNAIRFEDNWLSILNFISDRK